jgi:hypothetical protein
LFRLHVRGGRVDGAETGPLTAADTERLCADARDALTELARPGCGANVVPAG